MDVDTDLNRNIAANDEVIEITRHFIKQSKHTKRLLRNLGQIAIRMKKTGIVSRGFCSKKWTKLSNREKEFGKVVAR